MTELIINCTKCGHGKKFNNPLGFETMNRANWTPILNASGWQCLPRVLCRSCGCPMDGDEMIIWAALYDRAKQVEDREIKIIERDSFAFKMREKYGWQVDRFFATTD